MTAYIARNYERDAEGRWFFQNGPQRVFVDLEYTPFVYRTIPSGAQLGLEAHTRERATALSGAWIDESGAMLLETEHGVGIVDDRDLDTMLGVLVDSNGAALSEDALDQTMSLVQHGEEAPLWLKLGESEVKVRFIHSGEVPARFGFTAHPTDAQEALAASRSARA